MEEGRRVRRKAERERRESTRRYNVRSFRFWDDTTSYEMITKNTHSTSNGGQTKKDGMDTDATEAETGHGAVVPKRVQRRRAGATW